MTAFFRFVTCIGVWTLLAIGGWTQGERGKLIPCPDCTKEVSYRAISCPHCGCPGSAIHAYFLEIYPPGGAVQFPVLRVLADQHEGYALCIDDGGVRYLLLDADLLNGAEVIQFFTMPENQRVETSGFEVADRVPLARMVIVATNMQAIAVAPEQEQVQQNFVKVGADENLSIDQQPPNKETREFWSTDSRTRLVAASVKVGPETLLIDYRSITDWAPVRRLAFREQTGLLETAKNASSAALTGRLERTTWVRKYLQERATERLR